MDDGTVVGRAFEIINTVALRIQTPLAELAARTGIPKPTARRIAEDLCGGRFWCGRRTVMP